MRNAPERFGLVLTVTVDHAVFLSVDGFQASLSTSYPVSRFHRTWQIENIVVFGRARTLWPSTLYNHKLLYNHKQQFPFLHAELNKTGSP